MFRATYGSHSDEEHQAFVRPPHARAATTSRRVVLGTSFALLGAAAATAAYVAFVEPPKPMPVPTTKLEAATLAESLAAELSLDDSTDTTFEALDMDGDGVVTKNEYLSRLQARRDDVLAQLEQSNLKDDAKEPIATMIRDNFENEVACVTNIFDMSGDRVVDKTTFEFVHPLIASLCKKTPGNGGIAVATSESAPTAPPQVDIDGNVIPASGESGVGIDGGPSVPNQSIDGNVPVPVETPASNFNDDILVPTPAVPENDESSAAGDSETPSADQGSPNPSDNGAGPAAGGDEGTDDDSATPGADTSATEAPGTDEDVNDTGTDENDTGDDAAPPIDNAPVNSTDENGGDEVTPTTSTETPASDDNDTSEAPAADETAPADENEPGPSADETGDNAGPSGIDENNGDQESTTSPGEDVSGNGEDETTAAPGGDVDTEEATTEPTSADDQSTTAPGEDVGANGDEDTTNAPEDNVDDNEELTIAPDDQTPTAPGEDTGANGEDETTNAPGDNEETTTPSGEEDQSTMAPDEDTTANGSNDEDEESTTTPTSAASAPSSGSGGGNNATENASETPQTESTGAVANSPVSSMLSEIQNAVNDVSLPGDGTVNATTGGIAHQDPAVIKAFLDDLNPSENSSDPSAPEQKSPERVAFESELAKDLADKFSDRTQRLAFANMEVKKNAFVINLIQECITHAGRRFEFDASFTRDKAAEWIKTKCLVFPDLFQHKENP